MTIKETGTGGERRDRQKQNEALTNFCYVVTEGRGLHKERIVSVHKGASDGDGEHLGKRGKGERKGVLLHSISADGLVEGKGSSSQEREGFSRGSIIL